MINLNKYWFKPKKYGYGAYPSTWEGWVLTAFYIVLLILIIQNINYSRILFYISIIIWTIPYILLTKEKSEDEWKWRWGNK